MVDVCHCSTPFHILERQLSKANKQSSRQTALNFVVSHVASAALFAFTAMFYSQKSQLRHESNQRAEHGGIYSIRYWSSREERAQSHVTSDYQRRERDKSSAEWVRCAVDC